MKVIFASFMYTNLQEKLSIHLIVWKTWKQTSPTNRRSWIEGYGLSKNANAQIGPSSDAFHIIPLFPTKSQAVNWNVGMNEMLPVNQLDATSLYVHISSNI